VWAFVYLALRRLVDAARAVGLTFSRARPIVYSSSAWPPGFDVQAQGRRLPRYPRVAIPHTLVMGLKGRAVSVPAARLAPSGSRKRHPGSSPGDVPAGRAPDNGSASHVRFETR
jgi:hypothetical protein